MAIVSSMSLKSFFYFTFIFTIYLLLNFNSSVNGNSFPLDQQQLPQQQQQQQKIDNDFLRSSKSISTRTSGTNFGIVGPRMFQISRSKIPIELDLLVDNNGGEILEQKSKRYDDYGHLRFGKRGGEDNFDDYGHMRFGRSL